MQSLVMEKLHKEILDDQLRMAGYLSRIERRRHDRRERIRKAVGALLVTTGERFIGSSADHATQAVANR